MERHFTRSRGHYLFVALHVKSPHIIQITQAAIPLALLHSTRYNTRTLLRLFFAGELECLSCYNMGKLVIHKIA